MTANLDRTRLVMVTDFGTCPVTPAVQADAELVADMQQTAEWLCHEDELVGVPEVEPFSSSYCALVNRRAHVRWAQGLDEPHLIEP
jgi:hypothetical protein